MGVLLHETHRLALASAGADRYPVVPIDVPDGAAEIRVRYELSEPDGRVDLGLVDPRGAGPGLPGFRGWSGSARREVALRTDTATPGYLAGALPAGRWGVVLGLYQVPTGCRVEVTVEVDDNTDARSLDEGPLSLGEARPSPSPPPAPKELAGMVAGDLHSHTVHSADAARPIPVAVLVAAAEEAGLSFLAVTDHNTVSHHRAIERLQAETPLTLILGQEVTTYLGHFNVWGTDRLIDFRVAGNDDLERSLAAVAEQGAVASICHPKHLGPQWELGVPETVTAVEAWGAPWVSANAESLAFWDGLVRRGRRITAVGGSDIHDFTARRGHSLATPTTWVPSGEDPLQAVRAGRVVVSQNPSGPLVLPLDPAGRLAVGREVEAGSALAVRVVRGDGGRVRMVGPSGPVAEADANGDDVHLDLGRLTEAWARCELWGPGLFLAGPVAGRYGTLWSMANPVYRAES